MKKMIAVLMLAVTLTSCFGGALVVVGGALAAVNNATEVTKGLNPIDWDEIDTEDLPVPGGDKSGKWS